MSDEVIIISQNLQHFLISITAPLSGHFKVSVHDEVFAVVHAGIVGINLDFFVARICYKGETSYNLNIFQVQYVLSMLRYYILNICFVRKM